MKKLAASLCMAMGALVCAQPVSAAIALTFTPSSQHVNIGDTASIDVAISGLGSQILSGFDLNFFFNGAVMGSNRSVDATSATGQMGNLYGTPPSFSFDVVASGQWGLVSSALASDLVVAANQADSFLLAHFTFLADHDGVSSFGLGADPSTERKFVGLDQSILDVSIGSACVAVGTGQCENSVPEPASLALLGLGFAGLASSRRKRLAEN